MNTGIALNRALLLAAGLFSYFLPLHWGWRLGIFYILACLIIRRPIIILILSQIRSTRVNKEDVFMAMRINVWQTATEVKRSIDIDRGIRASLIDVMFHVYELSDSGTIQGRERFPPKSAFFGDGNVWEYSRKPL